MQKNKGYYRALCACLCLLVVGGATAYYGINRVSEKPKLVQKPAEVSRVQESPSIAPVIVNQSPDLTTAKTAREKQQEQAKTELEKAELAKAEEAKTEEQALAKASEKEKTEPNNESIENNANAELSFSQPITGELVMDYNMEHAIYDPTLEQFRTNNCISIAGNEGDTVKAAEDGTVANVVEQVERGITVVINHNNGWETTYSQLQDNVKVKKGDQVKKGQDIGLVAKPTKYGSALGNHLDFAVIKDGQYVDPKSALAQ